MIYYPLSVLMLAGIRDVLIITSQNHREAFQNLLGDGARFGVHLEYAVQSQPDGLAQAFLIGADFIGDDSVCLILGDNIFYGQGFSDTLRDAAQREAGATIFAYAVTDPENFGVVEFDVDQRAISLEEKPAKPRSRYAVPGLYFYDNDVIGIARKIRPSVRGELEITSVNQAYLERGDLHVELLGRGFAWLDTGTFNSLLSAAHFVETIQTRQGVMIACLEEIALNKGWITLDCLKKTATDLRNSSYGEYLATIFGRQLYERH